MDVMNAQCKHKKTESNIYICVNKENKKCEHKLDSIFNILIVTRSQSHLHLRNNNVNPIESM